MQQFVFLFVRCEVLAAIVNRYYSSVASVSSRSHRAACRISSRLLLVFTLHAIIC